MGLTATNIITDAMIARGVHDPGETPDNPVIQTHLRRLNRMLDLWSVRKLTVYVVSEDTHTLTISDGQYSIGSGGDIDTTRPVKIDHAYLRDSNGYDYPVDCTMTEDEYNAIPLKSQSNRPGRLFYQNTVPTGTIKFDYLPDAAYTAHFFSQKPLTAFADISTEYDFPTGYEAALTANLAIVLDYPAIPVSQELRDDAIETLDAIKTINLTIPKVELNGVPGVNRRGGSNIMTM